MSLWGFVKVAVFYPVTLIVLVLTFWGLSSWYTMHLVKDQSGWRSRLLKDYQNKYPPRKPVVPTAVQISIVPLMWRVSGFLSEAECDYVKEAYLPTFTSCFPGAPETLVWWLGRWASWGSIRVCQEMNQELERGAGYGNELLEVIEKRIHNTLREANLYLGKDGQGMGFATESMDFQIVRYRRGGKFRYHYDETMDAEALPLTFMVYLSDKPEGGGGGTNFPRANSGEGLVVDAGKGDLLVWSTCGERKRGGEQHEYAPSSGSYHSGLEVEGQRDEKWILNMFFSSFEVSCHDMKVLGRLPDLERPLQYVVGGTSDNGSGINRGGCDE